MENVTRVGIFNNIAPLYIRPLWDKLLEPGDIRYTFITSSKGHEGIKTIDPTEFLKTSDRKAPVWYFVKNIYLAKILVYQIGVLKLVLKNEFDVYVFAGDMYTISTWLAAAICKIRGNPVFFWGHGYYGNEGFFKKNIRLLFYRIADYHFLYGNRARKLLINMGFNADRLFTVYNSLDYRTHKMLYANKDQHTLRQLKKKFFPDREHYPTMLFIGRLTKRKKISLLINAIRLQREKGNEFNCILVGDGQEKDKLLSEIHEFKLGDCFYFYGSCYDDAESSKLIMLSDSCVSPGNVGLTAIHCLSLGTPVITHDNFNNQMPEVESVIENKTGFYFEENNVESLSEAIENFVGGDQKQLMEAACINMIEENFNPQNQFKIISEAIKKAYSVH